MFLSDLTKIKASRPGDNDFVFSDGLMMTPRAGIEICGTCPDKYKLIIIECMNKGWVRPIAYRHLHEDLIEKLTK